MNGLTPHNPVPGATAPLVEMVDIDKSFPGVRALSGVRFDLMPGEVHALMGENGAGKSTLMKILSGVYSKDAGEIRLGGMPVEIGSPRQAQDMGIGIIHQELALMRDLTAAQNIFIGREPKRAMGNFLLDEDSPEPRTRQRSSSRMNLEASTLGREGRDGLTVAKQQMVEIARALSFRSQAS